MKSKLVLALFSLIVALPTIARADHTVPEGAVGRLHTDTHQLEYNVRNSSLKYQVKQAVVRLLSEVSALYQCVGSTKSTWDHTTIPEACEFRISRIQQAWYPVDRFLYDTSYDYPYVYRSYLLVRRDVQVLP